ncbi:MAG: Stp1/IreP family PP2C-type Ser/Thr phosphatase [Chloroflexota bacterium]
MYHPGRSIRLRSSARSDRGRVRQNNEDSVHLWDADTSVLAVVADGMGGAVAGEEASRIAIETIQGKLTTAYYRSPDDYSQYDSEELAELLGDAVREANDNIMEKVGIDPELKGMGTTVTMAFARANDVILAHVGDSRAYYIDSSDESIEQLTSDHSFVQALVDAGHITDAEAENHPMKNVLYRALGQADELDVDVLMDIRIHAGDRLLLCSDGLTLHVNAEEIAKTAMSSDDPQVISDKLVNLANERGGKDNVSVIVIVAEWQEEKENAIASADAETVIPLTNGEDEPTIPMNPDYLNVTRANPSLDTIETKDDPQATQETPSAGIYGEGNDSFDMLF